MSVVSTIRDLRKMSLAADNDGERDPRRRRPWVQSPRNAHWSHGGDSRDHRRGPGDAAPRTAFVAIRASVAWTGYRIKATS